MFSCSSVNALLQPNCGHKSLIHLLFPTHPYCKKSKGTFPSTAVAGPHPAANLAITLNYYCFVLTLLEFCHCDKIPGISSFERERRVVMHVVKIHWTHLWNNKEESERGDLLAFWFWSIEVVPLGRNLWGERSEQRCWPCGAKGEREQGKGQYSSIPFMDSTFPMGWLCPIKAHLLNVPLPPSSISGCRPSLEFAIFGSTL